MTGSGARVLYPAGRVSLRELGLRDGLQMAGAWPGTDAKLAWIAAAHAAGVRHIEVGSFLPSGRYPQFADVRELVAAVDRLPGAHASVLTLNERAVADALGTPVSEVVTVVSATEGHSHANMRRSRSSAIGLVRTARAERDRAGSGFPVVTAAISVAFGCSLDGEVEPDTVLGLADSCLEAGAEVISVADTVGVAGPRQVGGLCRRLLPLLGGVPLVVHLHDTRGTGIANAFAALDAGARVLDGTIGGLGGCPFAPGATGNVVFEDLVYLCERSGFPTGIDVAGLDGVRSILASEMPDEPLSGSLARAGVPEFIDWTAGKTTPRSPT